MIHDFEACAACAAKSGSSLLCESCIANRKALYDLAEERDKWRDMNPLKFAVIRVMGVIGVRLAQKALRMSDE